MSESISKRLGTLQSFKKIENGITGKTTAGFFRVRTFSDSIFNVTISKVEEFEDFSYAIASVPGSAVIELEDQPQAIIVRTSKLELSILKNPVSFILKDKAGNVLNEDDPGLGTSWIGDQVCS